MVFADSIPVRASQYVTECYDARTDPRLPSLRSVQPTGPGTSTLTVEICTRARTLN